MSQPFLSPLFTVLRGRGILRTSLVECSPKFRSTSVHTPRSAPVLWRCVWLCVFLCVHEHHFTGHASSPPAATATQSPFGPAAAPYKAGRERNPTSGRPVRGWSRPTPPAS